MNELEKFLEAQLQAGHTISEVEQYVANLTNEYLYAKSRKNEIQEALNSFKKSLEEARADFIKANAMYLATIGTAGTDETIGTYLEETNSTVLDTYKEAVKRATDKIFKNIEEECIKAEEAWLIENL